ncbi:MAG: GNAT family N-acetyltransferase [Bauldia sp.]|nr:GNAT family N-acetyltransferase [Bauldia sp.]
MSKIETSLLSVGDAHELAPLLAACAQELKRGAPRRPDEFYAELLLNDRTAAILGARFEGSLAGYAIFFDLPNTTNGRRIGQLDEVFVIQDSRDKGIEKALLDAIAAEAVKRDWDELRWVVPQKPEIARTLAERFGHPGGWSVFSVPIK